MSRFFKVNHGTSYLGSGVYIREGQVYKEEELNGTDVALDDLLQRKEWQRVELYKDQIGETVDKNGNAPLLGIEDDGTPVYGIPHVEVPLVTLLSESEYQAGLVANVEAKPTINKFKPWQR